MLINSSLKDPVTLNLNNVSSDEAIDLLLTQYHLLRYKLNDNWVITTHQQFIKQKEEKLKRRQLREKTLPLQIKFWRLDHASAKGIAELIKIDLLSKRGTIKLDKRTNIICVIDIEDKLSLISQLIKNLDKPVAQIKIDAKILSIDHDYEKDLGLAFRLTSRDQHSPDAAQNPYTLAFAIIKDNSSFDIKLSALEDKGLATLISSPSLFTLNQKQAMIEAGEEVPYQEVSEGGGTGVMFKKAVLALKVTPQILPHGEILLDLQINQDRPSKHLIKGVPTISTRQIMTTVRLQSGQTIVLGGIYESNDEKLIMQFPFLSNIPIVGMLFKHLNKRENKRELLIFVTPKIV